FPEKPSIINETTLKIIRNNPDLIPAGKSRRADYECGCSTSCPHPPPRCPDCGKPEIASPQDE
ncbi:MAG: hypothetical protein AB1742_14510, partial [bacterium]